MRVGFGRKPLMIARVLFREKRRKIVSRQSLGFAVGPDSPFGRLYDLGGHILLVGVGHNRNTFLHYAETLTPRPRLKVRRFPQLVDSERVWIETDDVGDDKPATRR